MSEGSNKKIAKNTIFLSLRMFFVLIVSLYTSRVFFNVLGVEDFGICNVVAGFVSMFTFLNSALANGIQRFYNFELGKNNKDAIQNVYISSVFIQSSLAIIVFILLETVGLWYINHKLVIPTERLNAALWMFHFATISTVLVILRIPYDAAILAYERMNFYALSSILDVALKLILALVIPFISFDKIVIYGLFLALISFFIFVLNYLYAKISFPYLKFRFFIDWLRLKAMLSFSGWNLFGTFACVAREQGLNIILNLFFGPIVNASRGIAYQVTSALQGFVQNLTIAAKPQMIQAYASGDSERSMRLMYKMSKASFFILYLMALPLIYEIHYVLSLWLGSVPKHSTSFVIIVLLTNFLNNLNAPVSIVIYATGKMKVYESVFSLINIMILPITYCLLKVYDIPEIAFVVYFIMTVFVQIACLHVLRNFVFFSYKEYFRQVLAPIIVVIILTFYTPLIIQNFIPYGFERLVIVCLSSTIISLFVIYKFGLDQVEKVYIHSILLKLYKKIK